MNRLSRVLDIAFKRVVEGLPTFQGEHHGRIRWNTATKSPAFADDTRWWNIVGNGQILTSTGAAPTITLDVTKVGSTSTITTETRSTDMAGRFEIVTSGTGYASGAFTSVAFAVAKASSTYTVLLQAGSSDSAALNPYTSSRSTTGFNIVTDATPQVGKTYAYHYLVIERL